MSGVSLTLFFLKVGASILAVALELINPSPHGGYSVPKCGRSFVRLLGESSVDLP